MTKKDFIDYCNENLDVEWYDMAKALDCMDKSRCPLRMTGDSGDTIIDAIRELAEDFIEENDLDPDWFEDNFDDEEEVFWELDEKLFEPKEK